MEGRLFFPISPPGRRSSLILFPVLRRRREKIGFLGWSSAAPAVSDPVFGRAQLGGGSRSSDCLNGPFLS
jgi:hypothetical protein